MQCTQTSTRLTGTRPTSERLGNGLCPQTPPHRRTESPDLCAGPTVCKIACLYNSSIRRSTPQTNVFGSWMGPSILTRRSNSNSPRGHQCVGLRPFQKLGGGLHVSGMAGGCLAGRGGEGDACGGVLSPPTGLSPLTLALPSNPLPPQAAVPIGLSPPRAPPLPLPGLPSPPHTPPSLPFGGRAKRSPQTVPVSLLRVGSARRRATALAIGQGSPGGHPRTGRRVTFSATAAVAWDVHLRGHLPRGHITT